MFSSKLLADSLSLFFFFLRGATNYLQVTSKRKLSQTTKQKQKTSLDMLGTRLLSKITCSVVIPKLLVFQQSPVLIGTFPGSEIAHLFGLKHAPCSPAKRNHV